MHTAECFYLQHRLKLAFLKEGEPGQASIFRIQRLKFADRCSIVFVEWVLCYQATKTSWLRQQISTIFQASWLDSYLQPLRSMKPIKDEVRSAIKTTPLIKHKSLALLNVPSSTSTSTGWCNRNSITRASRESKARIFLCVLRLRAWRIIVRWGKRQFGRKLPRTRQGPYHRPSKRSNKISPKWTCWRN